jgi:putative spermidine/putrescine transport system ATP-binding protein
LADLLRRLHITAIHVTHDQQEALAIADRLAVMQAGRIVQVGDGETLYRTPAHPFVAAFLGRVNRLALDDAGLATQTLNLGGLALACPELTSAQTVQGAALLVRPEDIEVAALAPGWGRADVARRSFLGDRVQLTLTVAGHPPLQADVARDHPARTGDSVGIRIATRHLMPLLETGP